MTFNFACKATLLCTFISLSATAQSDTLLDIYEFALSNDPTLQAAEATAQAGGLVKQQAISQLLPQIDGSYSYSDSGSNSNQIILQEDLSTTPISTTPISIRRNGDSTIKSYSVTLTQNIFNMAAYFGYKQSKALGRQSELNFNLEQQQLILRVTEAYFAVLRGKDNLTSSLAEEKAIAQQLEQTQQRFEVGLIAITDVHEAQAAYDLAIANRLTEEVNLDIAYEGLAVITGQQHYNLYNLSEEFPITKPKPANIEQWVSFASTNNLSIQLAEQSLAAANQNAKVKTSFMLPSVQAIASYRNSNDDRSGFDKNAVAALPDSFSDVESTKFEIRVDVPIFAGGLKNAERKQAGFERVAEQAKLVATKRKAFQNARSSYLTTVADNARIKARKRAITSALSALDATQAGYDAGTRNIVDLLNAQRDLFRAQRDYANTRYDYVINSLTLKLAAGTISPVDINGINQWLVKPAAARKSQQGS